MNTTLYGGLIELSPDGQPITPELVLALRSGTKQGVIHNVQSLTNTNGLVEVAEISFDVYKATNNNICELWDEIRDFRLVYIPHLDNATFNPWYELSVEVDESDCTIKHCHGIHLHEAELGQLILNGIEINTEKDISRDDYKPTVIYNAKDSKISALDRILKDKATHYKIEHVDSSIAVLQRTFSWDGTDIKDAFDEIAEEVECLFKYGESLENDGKIHRTISVYDLNDRCMDCGERGSFTDKTCPKCGSKNINFGYGVDSGIFLSHENFAGDINYSSNSDDVKNCFRLEAGDNLMTATIRNINPSGSQYIWHISEKVRDDMSPQLRARLDAYDKEYALYKNNKTISIPSDSVVKYNTLIDKYKNTENKFTNAKYPIVGYSALTDLYYAGLNFHSYLKTTLAPATARGTHTTAKNEITKLTSESLSPLGIQNADRASATTVTSAIQNYAKVFIDTSLYRVIATNVSYNSRIWKGTITLTGYVDETDKATTPQLSIRISDAQPDFIKCQLEKAMKKNEVDATGTVALFKKSDIDFKKELDSYSVDNLSILANIARGCLDVLIQQGAADPSNPMYNSIYMPYYNKSGWIQDELRERENELLVLRGTKALPTGLLDYIEAQRLQIAKDLDIRSYLGEDLWAEFCSFRRDDTYKNDNFISDGLSDADLIKRAKEFLKSAEREIIKSATLQHSISCNLNNLLLVKESDISNSPTPVSTLDGVNVVTDNQAFLVKDDTPLSPILLNFDVGNWIHIEIDEIVYRLRLTSYRIDYDNLDTLDVEFSDVTYGLGYMSDIQSILSQAQSMATSYPVVQQQANKGNFANKQIMDMVENGLNLTNKKIVNAADNQNMLLNETGLLMREKNEFGDDYSPEQIKIINHGFYYTKDNWKTVQTGLGKYVYYDPETGTYKEDYGLIAQKIVGNIILSNELGIYNTSGSVKIDENGVTITADPTNNNKDLFTVQKKNEDGTLTKHIYVDNDGNIKLSGNAIEISADSSIASYVGQRVNQAIENIDIGTRNLIRNSDEFVAPTSDNPIKSYSTVENLIAEETYTTTIWGELANTKNGYGISIDLYGVNNFVTTKEISKGVHSATITLKSGKYINPNNEIPRSIEPSGAIYNQKGFKENTLYHHEYRAERASTGVNLTGYIPFGTGSNKTATDEWVLRFKGTDFDKTLAYEAITFFDKDFNYICILTSKQVLSAAVTINHEIDGNKFTKLDLSGFTAWARETHNKEVKYIRLHTHNLNADSVISVNKSIEPGFIPNIVTISSVPAGVSANCSIEKIKLEKGNKSTDWLPALEEMSERISSIKQDADGINLSVSELSETVKVNKEGTDESIASLKETTLQMTEEQLKVKIQSAVDGHTTTKVTTEMGYTFDDSGLKIEKTGAPTKTTITEDGMRVSENNIDVLVANNQGVDARNLKATTYLIIGKNSRFEDYGDRTGCFYIRE